MAAGWGPGEGQMSRGCVCPAGQRGSALPVCLPASLPGPAAPTCATSSCPSASVGAGVAPRLHVCHSRAAVRQDQAPSRMMQSFSSSPCRDRDGMHEGKSGAVQRRGAGEKATRHSGPPCQLGLTLQPPVPCAVAHSACLHSRSVQLAWYTVGRRHASPAVVMRLCSGTTGSGTVAALRPVGPGSACAGAERGGQRVRRCTSLQGCAATPTLYHKPHQTLPRCLPAQLACLLSRSSGQASQAALSWPQHRNALLMLKQPSTCGHRARRRQCAHAAYTAAVLAQL